MGSKGEGIDTPPPGSMDDPLLSDLNPVQREAVLFGEGPILVLAGAGSGKTRVLTRRIAHLILRRDVPPERILAVTFTNKAAGEMRERVTRMLGYDAAGLWIGTFHSLCLRLLRRHGDRLGFRGEITVFDADDQLAVLKQLLKDRGGEAEDPRVRDLRAVISLAKNRLWDPDDLEREWPKPDRHRLAALYRDYQQRLRSQGGADFDDLLVLAVRLLEGQSDLGEAYARKFLHVLVDEYQDTNHVQFRLVRRLAQGHGNVLVVGDDDQSIYRWRGADITNILEFERHFPQPHILEMTQNYRSTGAILQVASAVVRNNRGRREKSLWTRQASGERPVLQIAADEEEEAWWVADRIRRSVRSGSARAGEFAILYRVHAQSRPLEEACLAAGLPYLIVGGILFYQRREVKDLVAYLKLAVNPRDQVSFERALSAPSRGIGAVGLRRILEAASDGDLVQACAERSAEAGLRGRALQAACDFGRLLQDLAKNAAAGPEPLLRRVLEETGYVNWLKGSGEGDWEERHANVLELLEGAARFHAEVPEESLTAWLDQVALYTNLDTQSLGEERVTLMTVHNAKGLEFPHVFITGLEEGLFPHASSFDDPEELEEERRLFYVAATRAMRTLFLSASLERRRVNRLAEGRLSRFVEEIPEEMLDTGPSTGSSPWRLSRGAPIRGRAELRSDRGVGHVTEADGMEDSGDGSRAEPEEATIRREPLAAAASWKGKQVVHAVFGIGRVVEQEGSAAEARLTILFPQVGRKKVVARFVRPLS